MKMADGGFRTAYNVQFATDTKSTAIAGVSVDNSDMGKMLPMNDALSVHSPRRAMATALAPPDWAAIHRELKRKHVTLSLRVTYGPYVTQNRKEGPHMRAGRLGRNLLLY